MPVSAILIRTFSSSCSSCASTAPPLEVNLTALESRFQKTCCNLSASARTTAGLAGNETLSATCLACDTSRKLSTAMRSTAPTSTSCSFSRNLPVTMRETSSRSSMS